MNNIPTTPLTPAQKKALTRKKANVKDKSGPTRKKTDVNHPAMLEVFSSLSKVAKNLDSQNIAGLICKVVTADMKNLIPGDIVIRTQKSIDTLQKINEDMVYGNGGMFLNDNVPDALNVEGEDLAQLDNVDNNASNPIDKIKAVLPEPNTEPEVLDGEVPDEVLNKVSNTEQPISI